MDEAPIAASTGLDFFPKTYNHRVFFIGEDFQYYWVQMPSNSTKIGAKSCPLEPRFCVF